MIEVVLVFGLVVFAGMALILAKLPRRMSLWLLGHHMWLDIAVTLITLWIHMGTMTGLMAAAVAGLTCSFVTSSARTVVGYRRDGKYYPGWINLKRTT
jgi:hypothetical protein